MTTRTIQRLRQCEGQPPMASGLPQDDSDHYTGTLPGAPTPASPKPVARRGVGAWSMPVTMESEDEIGRLRELLRQTRAEAAAVHDELYTLANQTSTAGRYARAPQLHKLCDRLAVIAYRRGVKP